MVTNNKYFFFVSENLSKTVLINKLENKNKPIKIIENSLVIFVNIFLSVDFLKTITSVN